MQKHYITLNQVIKIVYSVHRGSETASPDNL